MARFVIEWVCRSPEEREQALPLLLIGHDARGGRLLPVGLPLDDLARRVRLHPDSLQDHISDWDDKLTTPVHVYDRKSERYVSVAVGDPQWLAGVCQPTLDENYFCTAIEEREGSLDEVLAQVAAELLARYSPQLVG